MNAQDIERAAAGWRVRRASDEWSPDDQACLDTWMNENLAHRIAYLRADTAWREVGRLQAIQPGSVRDTVPSRGMSLRWVPPASPSLSDSSTARSNAGGFGRGKRSLTRVVTAIAASTIVALIGIELYSSGMLGPHRYTTPVGRIRTLALTDGSNVVLNTDSRIQVEITSKVRHIELDKGEAFFKVARDPARPFIVEVGDRRVTAVGTEFSVRRAQDDIRVTVTEGAVRVDPVSGASSSSELLHPGNVARIRERGMTVEQQPLPQTEESLSWRQGFLIFRDSALADAVAEFNRYNTRRIVIADPSIADLKIGGHFRATGTEVFLWMLQNGFPVAVEQTDKEVVLKRR